jgi:hypothetical protein
MKLISETDMKKGETYYIECTSKMNEISGKKSVFSTILNIHMARTHHLLGLQN